MSKTGYLLKNISLINIILTGVIILLIVQLTAPFLGKEMKQTVTFAEKPPEVKDPGGESYADTSVPSAVDYQVISEQNLFNPERKIPEAGAKIQTAQAPQFILYGTLITDDIRIAYLEDKKSPQSTPGRGKRQLPLKLGDTISGYSLKEIEPEKIMLARGTESITVYLDDPNNPKVREAKVQTGKVAPPKTPHKMPSTPQQASTEAAKPVEKTDKPAQSLSEVIKKEPTSEERETARKKFIDFFRRKLKQPESE